MKIPQPSQSEKNMFVSAGKLINKARAERDAVELSIYLIVFVSAFMGYFVGYLVWGYTP